MGLIKENNEQYYEGSQTFEQTGDRPFFEMATTFNTDLVFGSYDPTISAYALNNFKLYRYDPLNPVYEEYVKEYTVLGNTITVLDDNDAGTFIVQLKANRGGNVGDRDAYGSTVEDNYGSYQYVTLNNVVSNFDQPKKNRTKFSIFKLKQQISTI